MKKLLVSAAIAGACMFGVTGQASADGHCGSLTMAEWNWASGELMANVDKIILEEGYGCEVELVAGATIPTFTSMNEKGEPDVAGELWVNAVREPLFKAIDEGRLVSAVKGPITQLGEGWWVRFLTGDQGQVLLASCRWLHPSPQVSCCNCRAQPCTPCWGAC